MVRRTNAFSLVELSIVLVILGLLTGGILAGQSLIRAAELRSVATQYQSHQVAFRSFRDKYFSMPGDMTNATQFWGTQASPLTTASTGPQTCNGNGNGKIESDNPACNESFRSWQQLANAGLMEGSYSGISNNPMFYTTMSMPGNSPRGRLGNSLWYIETYGPFPGTTYIQVFQTNQSGNVFQFGGPSTYWENPVSPLLKPEEAWNIDTKLDDGMPALGKAFVMEPFAAATSQHCTTATASTQTNANYLLSNSAPTCALLVYL